MLTIRYIFPGLALGAALGQTGVVTNAMINRAAEVTLNTLFQHQGGELSDSPTDLKVT